MYVKLMVAGVKICVFIYCIGDVKLKNLKHFKTLLMRVSAAFHE